MFSEILKSLKGNMVRTILTGLAVSWGIFMLIVLLGAGNGLVNAFNFGSDRFASNTMMVGSGFASKPYDGFKAGRRMRLEDGDIDFLRGDSFKDHIDAVSATVGKDVKVSRGPRHFDGYIEGNWPDRAEIEKMNVVTGRFINENDVRDRRKVVVMPYNVVSLLTVGNERPEDLVGGEVVVEGVSFKLVGMTKSDEMRNDKLFYAPFTTVKIIYSKGKDIDDLTFTFHGLQTEEENEEFEKSLKEALNGRHQAAPDDESTFWIWNRFLQNMQMEKGNRIISIALWIIGIFTLLGGVVGVGNIMLITVRERTHEFGIRKAIGASPWSITRLIITESVAITAVFGYLGMVLGLAACNLLDRTLGSSPVEVMGETTTLLVNPTVGLDVAVGATLVLVVSGTLAGLAPAVKAARVRPIEALTAE